MRFARDDDALRHPRRGAKLRGNFKNPFLFLRLKPQFEEPLPPKAQARRATVRRITNFGEAATAIMHYEL